MRSFEIVDGSRRGASACAYLDWDEDTGALAVRLAEGVSELQLPMMFAAFASKGQREIPQMWVVRWVQERVVPRERQNLGQVLKANDLEFYDVMQLFTKAQGRCCQDDFFIREVTEAHGEAREHAEEAHEAAGTDGVAGTVHAGDSEGGRAVTGFSHVAAKGEATKTAAQKAGAAIRAARLELGITQVELAQRCGVRQSVISRLESGKGNPTVSLLADIARGLGKELAIGLV